MNYNETVKYLKTFIPVNKDKWNKHYGLEKFRTFLSLLGDPQDNLKFVHIGGTSGKGSTATFLSAILTAAGYKTGLHVSPDILTIRERMQIDGNCISQEQFLEIFSTIKPALEQMINEVKITPSYYEILLAMAFVYFNSEKCNIVVLEVGLGGRLDATNVVNCNYQIITNVGLDHTAVLGATKDLILKDKQEIIKPGSTVVSGITEADLQEIIEAKVKATGSSLDLLDKDFKVSNIIKNSDNTNTFSITLSDYTIDNLKNGLPGLFQVKNAAIAVAMARKLTKEFPKITETSIRSGLSEAKIPGRFRIYSDSPLVIADGAHNPDKIAALVESLKYFYPEKKFITIFRFKKRNDIGQSLTTLKQISSKILLTTSTKSGDMGVDPVYDQGDVERYSKDTMLLFIPSLKQAYLEAIALTTNTNQGILVTGSLYMINEFQNILC